jgi:hypothetical protein
MTLLVSFARPFCLGGGSTSDDRTCPQAIFVVVLELLVIS